jgi:hypothetical protein
MSLVIVASAATPRASATAASGTPAATGSARTPLGLGTRFVDIQSAPSELFPIQRGNGFLGFRGISHFDKCKSSRTSGVAVRDQADLVDFAVGFKQGPQLCVGGAVREVANKKFLHGFPFPVSQRKTSEFVGQFRRVSCVRMQRTRFKGKRVSSLLDRAYWFFQSQRQRQDNFSDVSSRLRPELIIPA